ncbi:MAG TPA: hypothetical protein VE990_04875 [Acidimicrobiales bacterium]|nr:hypothetical protein [Acidimicrobiales bacterium]
MTEPARVVLKAVDTRDLLAMIGHLDETIRELALIATGLAEGVAPTVDLHILRVMDRTRPVLFAAKESISRQAAEAWDAGRPTVDVVIELPAGSAANVMEVLEALEEVDEVSRRDDALLLPKASVRVAEFRRWFFCQVADELWRRAGSRP